MNTSYALDAYRSHDLSISMKTSSGDVINMDFSNQQELSMNSSKNQNGSSSSLSFSSMQSFQYSVETNGIDAQDQKEIDAFMEVAQPYIDNFLAELDQGEQKSSVSQVARDIAEIFQPAKQKDENTQNYAKSNIVSMFDNSLKQQNNIDKIFEDAQKLLEKTLQQFDDFEKMLYA